MLPTGGARETPYMSEAHLVKWPSEAMHLLEFTIWVLLLHIIPLPISSPFSEFLFHNIYMYDSY